MFSFHLTGAEIAIPFRTSVWISIALNMIRPPHLSFCFRTCYLFIIDQEIITDALNHRRQRWKGSRQGRREASPQDSS
jgi:hypothetical protein